MLTRSQLSRVGSGRAGTRIVSNSLPRLIVSSPRSGGGNFQRLRSNLLDPQSLSLTGPVSIVFVARSASRSLPPPAAAAQCPVWSWCTRGWRLGEYAHSHPVRKMRIGKVCRIRNFYRLVGCSRQVRNSSSPCRIPLVLTGIPAQPQLLPSRDRAIIQEGKGEAAGRQDHS
jgi:hypothetical protein